MGDWFEKGLRFECKGCGKCCRSEPGYVWVSEPETISIAGFIGVSVETFNDRCVRKVKSRFSLREKPNGDCIFWEHGIGCRIYPVRPTQCRTFPFWKDNIESPDAWKQTGERCIGVGHGKLFRAHEVRKRSEREW